MSVLAPPKRKSINLSGTGSESQEQQALFLWWRILGHRSFRLETCQLFAIPNGGKRSLKTAARLKKEGVTAGIPDVFLAAPSGDKHGLFIELKRKDRGKVSTFQKASMAALEAAGYACVVARGWEAAKQAILDYLGEQA